METRLIKTKRDYEKAVGEIEALMELPESNDDAAARIELLALLVQKYEDEEFPVGEATPVEVIEFVMQSRGLTQKDLAPMFGSASRVSDFLAGRRGLSLATIVALNRDLHIPFDVLIDKKIVRLPRGRARRKATGTRRLPASPPRRTSRKKH